MEVLTIMPYKKLRNIVLNVRIIFNIFYIGSFKQLGDSGEKQVLK